MGCLLMVYALGLLPAIRNEAGMHPALQAGIGTKMLWEGTNPPLLGRLAAIQVLAAQVLVCTL